MIWAGLHFASHLRSDRLGEFTTVGTDLHRSESLAPTQLLIALGGTGTRRADAVES